MHVHILLIYWIPDLFVWGLSKTREGLLHLMLTNNDSN